ncbi:MAG: Fe-S protein assembly chaperone HscA [Bacteroidota bacterium]
MSKISINIKDGTIKKADVIVGIDLGTTNSLVALIDKASGQPVCLTANKESIVPSIVYFSPDGNTVVGSEAKQYLITEPQHTIYSVKRLLGRSYKDIEQHANSFGYRIIEDETKAMVRVEMNDKFYNPIELSALILKELKSRAETILKASVNKAVITVPAYFNDSQRQATRDAGKLAGLDVLRIVNEPTAASLAYGIGLQPDEEKLIAVYDLGGGTFDITILKIQQGVFEVLATNGDTYTGGDDFDRAIVEQWCTQFGIPVTELEKDKSLYQSLRLSAEEAKKQLSNSSVAACEFTYNDTVYTFDYTLAEFETAIASIVEKTMLCCKNAISDADVQLGGIDEVIMVGGSTRVPYVKQCVKQFFQKESLHDALNPDEVVALGAAIEADILAGNRKDILLLDVTPLSLGIETMGGLMDTLIPRNSKIPQKAGRQYTTSIDGQANLKIAVYQGERELVKDNRKLGEFILRDIPAMPAGFPKIDIQFLLNADGILKVNAVEERSNTTQSIDIRPQYGLTDAEVEKMLLESFKNAQSDMHERLLAESKTEAEQLIYQCNKLINANTQLLTVEEVAQTKQLLDVLTTAVQGNDRETINLQTERLNDYTRPFAERLMDQAVGKALTGKSLDAI